MGVGGFPASAASPIPLPPVARLLISPATQVVEGQVVTLSCSSGLVPTSDTRFSWYRNGVLFLEGPSSSLLLPTVSSSDAGSYYCRAQGSLSASGPSSPAILTVLREWHPISHCLQGGRETEAHGDPPHPHLPWRAHLTASDPGPS